MPACADAFGDAALEASGGEGGDPNRGVHPLDPCQITSLSSDPLTGHSHSGNKIAVLPGNPRTRMKTVRAPYLSVQQRFGTI